MSAKARILVVEDNESNLELLCDWLVTEGYDVLTAVDLKSAFDAVTSRPHAVLLDVRLGAENGLDLAKWMRRQSDLAEVPVIAVSAHAMVAEQEQMMQAGCNSFVSKPVDFRALREQLDRWVVYAPADR